MNNVNLIGRMTANAELKTGATEYCTFSLAVPRNRKDETDFINCVAFGKTAQTIAQYCGKGRQIGVSGRLQVDKFTKQDGTTAYKTEVVVDRMDFCGNANEPKDNAPANITYEKVDYSDTPFDNDNIAGW